MVDMDNAMKLHESCKYKGISLIFSLRGPTFAAYPIQAMNILWTILKGRKRHPHHLWKPFNLSQNILDKP